MKIKKKILLILPVSLLLTVVLSGFVSGSEVIKIESLSVTPSSAVVGEESKISVTVKNDGTENATGINVSVLAGGESVCSELIDYLIPGKASTVSCVWIPWECNPGEDSAVTASAKTKGSSAAARPVFVKVSGKSYITETSGRKMVNNEIAITVKDEEGKPVDYALVRIEFNGKPLPVSDAGTKNGVFTFTPAAGGIYLVLIEKERKGYCKQIKKEIEVKNSFIVIGLKQSYGVDDSVEVEITDLNENPVEMVNVIVSGNLTREFIAQKGILKFSLKDSGFVKGDYVVVFQEYKANLNEPSLFLSVTGNFTVADEPLPEPEEQKQKPEPETEPEPEPGEKQKTPGEPTGNKSGEPVTDTAKVAVHDKTLLEEYGQWILIIALILIILIASAVLVFLRKNQEAEKKQKPGGLGGVMKSGANNSGTKFK